MTDAKGHMAHKRDFLGYGAEPPKLRWPNGAGLALNFVLNVEEGSEYSIGDGDPASESALLEVRATRVPEGDRDLAAESMYEYGHRVGIWRIFDLFRSRGVPLTIFASAVALERCAPVAQAIAESEWDICAHGWRWIEHYKLDPETETDHIAKAHASILASTGKAPQGWYCRYAPSERTRELVAGHGGYLYDSDAYNDDLPYWTEVAGKAHLVMPYTMVNNDAKFLAGDVFSSKDFSDFLIDGFEVLAAEADRVPRMMSIGLHSRIIGHPGRVAALVRFLDHLKDRDDVWICRREDIARHWMAEQPFRAGA